MGSLAASVIVRVKDEQRTIERTLSLLRRQTVSAEIVVVDSGSTDGTLEVARRYADQLIEIPPEQFSYGGALNIGARAASADVHFALSAHCLPEREDWIALSLAHYERNDVAGTNGIEAMPDGAPVRGPVFETGDRVRAYPFWGFSNHASSWRASVWQQFPFDETITACEDKEWALRVMDAGWVIVFDPSLAVPLAHRWGEGARSYFRRNRKEAEALGGFVSLPPYGLRDVAHDWWSDYPDDRHSTFFHRFVNYLRFARILGRYVGQRSCRGRSAAPKRPS